MRGREPHTGQTRRRCPLYVNPQPQRHMPTSEMASPQLRQVIWGVYDTFQNLHFLTKRTIPLATYTGLAKTNRIRSGSIFMNFPAHAEMPSSASHPSPLPLRPSTCDPALRSVARTLALIAACLSSDRVVSQQSPFPVPYPVVSQAPAS